MKSPPNSTQLACSVPPEVVARLEALAAREGLSKSAFLRRSLFQALDRLDDRQLAA